MAGLITRIRESVSYNLDPKNWDKINRRDYEKTHHPDGRINVRGVAWFIGGFLLFIAFCYAFALGLA